MTCALLQRYTALFSQVTFVLHRICLFVGLHEVGDALRWHVRVTGALLVRTVVLLTRLVVVISCLGYAWGPFQAYS